jgi:hypothetical protein
LRQGRRQGADRIHFLIGEAERRQARIPLRRMGGALREIRVFAWPPLPLR